jgi:hypothetical protein
MLLQTLRTGDFNELAGVVPSWDLRFRQFGHGPFRGQLRFLRRGGIQVFQFGVNRMVHIEGWPLPGSYGYRPVLPENAKAIWSGRHLEAGQVRLYKPGQVTDHLTAADHYQLVALLLDADLVRQEVPDLVRQEIHADCCKERQRVGCQLRSPRPKRASRTSQRA